MVKYLRNKWSIGAGIVSQPLTNRWARCCASCTAPELLWCAFRRQSDCLCFAARSACFAFVLTSVAQVVAFVTCAFVQGLALIRWKLLAQSDKDGMWKYYALFVTFALVSSIAGALSFGLRMHKLSLFYEYSLLPHLNEAASPKVVQESQRQRLNAESRLYVTRASHSVNL